MVYLSLLGGGGLTAFNALWDRLGGEAALAIFNDHFVAVDSKLRGVARVHAGVNILLESGQKRSNVTDTKDAFRFLLQADLLNALKLSEFVGRDITLATSGRFDFPGGIHQIAGDGAFTGSGQIGHLVAGLGTAETAQTTTVDGRAQNNDFLAIGENTDHVADGRVDFEEIVGGLLDDSDNNVFRVLQGVESGTDGNIHTIDLNLLLGGEKFNLLIVEKDGDNLNH